MVKELVKIAKGVLESKTFCTLPFSDNLVIKYMGYEIPRLNKSGSEIIFAKFKFILKIIIKKINKTKAINNEKTHKKTL